MRLRVLLSEVWRDLATGATPVLALALVAAVLLGGLAFVDAFAIDSVKRDERVFVDSGAATWIITSPDSVSAPRCEALATLDGIQHSGALRSAGGVVAATLPSLSVPVSEGTSGFLSLLGADVAPMGVVLSSQVASRLSVARGDWLQLSDGQLLQVADVLVEADDGRLRDLEFVIVAPSLMEGAFDQCWAVQWPSGLADPNVLGYAVDGEDPQVAQLNTSLGREFILADVLESRPTRWAWIAAIGLGSALGAVWVWMRRLPLAAALHAGATSVDIAAMAILTSVSFVGAANAIVLGLALSAFAVVEIEDPAQFWASLGFVMTPASAAVVLATAVTAFMIRESSLFRMYKSR